MCASLTYRTNIMRTKSVHLDQGQEGACTGFGEEHVRALSPYPQAASNTTAQNVYYEARRQDEWEGENYEGSSVNGAMKAARQMGLITSWKWATTTVEAAHGLSYHGAGELGSWWYAGMWDTDDNGFVHPTGSKVGGHAYAIAGYKYINGGRAYRIENSWGPSWGDNGGAWISEFDFAALLADDGELAFPTKVRS
jgi:hypothetical protein